MTLAYDFPCHLDPRAACPPAELAAEIRRAASAAAAAAPGRIAKGSLSEAEAARHAATWAAIAADLDAAAAGQVPTGDHTAWEAKVHLLRRELHFRRKYDGERVGKGRLDPAEAAASRARLEAVHALYWRDLFAWAAPNGAAPAFGRLGAPSAAAAEARQWVRTHDTKLEAPEPAPEREAITA